MAYPSRLLNDNETVSVDLHPHWWFLAAPTIAIVAAIVAGVVTLVATEVDSTVADRGRLGDDRGDRRRARCGWSADTDAG